MITKQTKTKKPEFNNGFIIAMALFLEHKDNWQKTERSDLRLYGATDHLYDMEIPENLSAKLIKRIIRWRERCFHYRLENFKDSRITDSLFKEAEQILKAIDEEVFKTKKVIMRYR